MADAVIEVAGVCKDYRRGQTVTRVLDSASLRVDQGTCLFLVGPSGSGKTTLLSIIGCILTPDQGEVLLHGADVSTLSADELSALRRNRIGFVFQRFHLVRGLSAIDNVAIPLTLNGHSTSYLRNVRPNSGYFFEGTSHCIRDRVQLYLRQDLIFG